MVKARTKLQMAGLFEAVLAPTAVSGTSGTPGTPSDLPVVPTPEWVWIDTYSGLERWLAQLLESGPVALDCETSGLDVHEHRLGTLQLAARGMPVLVIDMRRVDPRALESVFDGERDVIIFNGAFDVTWLLAYMVDIDRIRVVDPFLSELVLDAAAGPFRRDGHYSLQAIVGRRLGLHLPKEEQVTDWLARPLSDAQFAYAARDVSVLFDVVDSQQRELECAGLCPTAQLEWRAVPAVALLELDGVPIDRDAWANRADRAVADQVRLSQQLTKLAGTGGLAADQGDYRFSTVNWDAAGQVLKLLQQRGHTELENTDAETLAQLVEKDPLVPVLIEYREAARRASTYGVEYLEKFVEPFDGRLHPRYFQMGASTGRMSAAHPSIQNVPRSADYRGCIRPGDGRCLVKVDYSQVELRLVADIAGDPALIRAFNDGLDVHALTASQVLGVPLGGVTRDDRQRAKSVNFGLCYGMGEDTLRRHAWQNYHVRFSEYEARAIRRTYFQSYRGVKRWHDQYRLPWEAAPVPIDTRTPLGRRRRNVTSFTEKLSSPVQGAGGDAIKGAMALTWERRAVKPASARVVLTVHDELVAECDVEDRDVTSEWLSACMRDALQPLLHHVPAVADASVGADWAGTPLEEAPMN